MDRTTFATPPRRLLGVWAHPDDDAYLSAALMGRVVDAGGCVTVVTATRGECGTPDPARHGSSSFGALREAELRAGLAVLGVTDVRLLGLRDGRLAEEDAEAQAAAVAAVIDEVDPDGHRDLRPRRDDVAPRPPGGLARGPPGPRRPPGAATRCSTPP